MFRLWRKSRSATPRPQKPLPPAAPPEVVAAAAAARRKLADTNGVQRRMRQAREDNRLI